jgi:hypothetical protein
LRLNDLEKRPARLRQSGSPAKRRFGQILASAPLRGRAREGRGGGLSRRALGGIAATVLLVAAVGCGRKPAARKGHGEAAATAAPAPPTPDTTPNAALRTPAGFLLLKGEKTPVPSPSPSPAAGAKS